MVYKVLRDPTCYDVLVGSNMKEPAVCIGEMAFIRCGLTTLLTDVLQLSTLVTGITGIHNLIAKWYFNPWADCYEFTKPSHKHPNILVPTRERAIIEYIIFKDYFDEGILIEGLKIYIQQNTDFTTLRDVAKYFKLKDSILDYWINEALTDEDD